MSLVVYTGHGTAQGWVNKDINAKVLSDLTNTNKFPLILSMACSTGQYGGKYMPQAALTNKLGGAIGMIAASAVSYSGFNEPILHGLINSFWPTPGLKTDFQYPRNPIEPGITMPCNPYTPTEENAVLNIFDALQAGFFRMEMVYPSSINYTNLLRDIYHVYGDPSMKFYSKVPKTLNCSVIRRDTYIRVSGIPASAKVLFHNQTTNKRVMYSGLSNYIINVTDP